MARLIGEELDARITKKIEKEASNPNTVEVVLLVTIDDRGFPHVSLLSFMDLALVSRKLLLLAIGRGSSSKRNLVLRRSATLIFWLGKRAGSVVYLKGRAKLKRELMKEKVEGFATSTFSFTVKTVSEDYSPEARLLSTITYDPRNTNSSHARLAKELKALGR